MSEIEKAMGEAGRAIHNAIHDEIRASEERQGAKLDSAIAAFEARQDAKLKATVREAVREIVDVVNANTDRRREDFNAIGVPVRSRPPSDADV